MLEGSAPDYPVFLGAQTVSLVAVARSRPGGVWVSRYQNKNNEGGYRAEHNRTENVEQHGTDTALLH